MNNHHKMFCHRKFYGYMFICRNAEGVHRKRKVGNHCYSTTQHRPNHIDAWVTDVGNTFIGATKHLDRLVQFERSLLVGNMAGLAADGNQQLGTGQGKTRSGSVACRGFRSIWRWRPSITCGAFLVVFPSHVTQVTQSGLVARSAGRQRLHCPRDRQRHPSVLVVNCDAIAYVSKQP